MKQKYGKQYRFGLLIVLTILFLISQFSSIITACHDWDKSSIILSGECDDGIAIFTITNTGEPGYGDMSIESFYHIYRNNEFDGNGTFQLDGGESITVSVDAQGDTIKMIAYQHADHPGIGFAVAIVEDCGCCDPDEPDDDNSSDVPDDNSSDVPDDNSSEVPDDNSSDVPDDNSSDVPDDNSSDVPDDNSSDVPDDNSTGNQDDDNSSVVPDDNSSDVPDDNSSVVPDDNSSEVPDDNTTTNPEDQSDEPSSKSNNNPSPSSNPSPKQVFYTGNEEIPNEKPIAISNIDNNTIFYTGEIIFFDGSNSYDSDGNITEWIWDFGPADSINSKMINRTFTEEGIYNIILQVVDDDLAENKTAFNIIIEQKNRAPFTPEISGKNISVVNNSVSFTFSAIDADHNDVQYFIDWGDGQTMVTDFIPESLEITIDHAWEKSGLYTIKVKAYDGQLYSEEQTMSITVNDIFTANLGYIILLIIAIITGFTLTTKTYLQDKAFKALMSA